MRAGFRRWLGEPDGEIGLGASTHELLVRLLSSWPLQVKRRIVTTTGEFHTLRRQLCAWRKKASRFTANQPTLWTPWPTAWPAR